MDYSSKKYLKHLYLASAMFLMVLPGLGQNIKVTMDAPTRVSISERFQLNITVNAEPTEFTPPNLNDFTVFGNPMQQSGGSSYYENGRIVRSYEFTYSYILQPKRTGKINLGTASYTVNGKKYTSNNLEIEVSGSGNPASQGSGQTNQQVDESGDLFLKVFLDKSTVYQGEFITASVKLYSRYYISSASPAVSWPSFNGFYRRDIETPPLRQLNREVINGKAYLTGVVQKLILIPQKSGELIIDPCKMIVTLNDDDFFFSSGGTQKEVFSKPVKVTVKPLVNRPASFTGGVGKFNLDVKYDKTKVKENDPVIMKISVTGAGNIELLEAPKVNFPEGIETSEPTVTNKTSSADGGISGSKQFEYLLIPRAPGKIAIPPIEFSYFDPVAKQYKTITSSSTTIEVEPGSGPSAVTGTAVSKEDLRFLGKDIEYIKLNEIKLRKKGTRFFGSFLFYGAYLIPFLLFLGVLVWRRNYIRQNANTALTRNRKAQKYAIKRLKKAKEYLAQSKKETFYEEVLKALWGYLSDKLSIPVSELSRENAREQLQLANVDDESIARAMTLLDTCEFARYAPASADNTMHDDYREAIAIIIQIQEKIR